MVKSTSWRSSLFAAVLLLGGCASAPHAPDPHAPLQRYNRAMFGVNEKVDKAVTRPIAVAYRNVTPAPMRRGIGNFFGNINDAWSALNDLLQLHVGYAANDILRVEVNTFFGIGGTIDIASEMGLYRHPNDFGLTLARYGIDSGPYFVLPVLGPSTVRDSGGAVVDDYLYAPLPRLTSDVALRNSATALNLVQHRASLLATTDLLESIAIDPYVFTRDAYLQRRDTRVHAVRAIGVLTPPDDAGGE